MTTRQLPTAGTPTETSGWQRPIRAALVYIALGVVLALTLPAEGGALHTWVSPWVEQTKHVIPGISRLASVSAFPAATELFLTVMWCLQPVLTIALIMTLPDPDPKPLGKWLLHTFVLLPALLMLVVYYPLVLYDMQPESLGYARGRGAAFATLLSQYRLGLGLIGSLVLAVSAFFQALAVLTIIKPRIKRS